MLETDPKVWIGCVRVVSSVISLLWLIAGEFASDTTHAYNSLTQKMWSDLFFLALEWRIRRKNEKNEKNGKKRKGTFKTHVCSILFQCVPVLRKEHKDIASRIHHYYSHTNIKEDAIHCMYSDSFSSYSNQAPVMHAASYILYHNNRHILHNSFSSNSMMVRVVAQSNMRSRVCNIRIIKVRTYRKRRQRSQSINQSINQA